MQREGFHGYQRFQKSNSNSGKMTTVTEMIQDHSNHTSSNIYHQELEDGKERGENSCMMREKETYMPITNVTRIMRKVLPPHAKISDDAKQIIQECVSEFINLITGEANNRCQQEQRKTITADDLLWAMTKLGFYDYIQPLTLYMQRYRELEGDCCGFIQGDPPLVMAHSPFFVASYAPLAFHMGRHHPPQGIVGIGAAPLGGYFRDSSAAASSHASMATLDPYASYK